MLFSSTAEFYQGGRTNIRKKLPEDTLTNASIDIVLLMLVLILFLANHQLYLEHCGKVLTLHLVECLVGFEQGTF